MLKYLSQTILSVVLSVSVVLGLVHAMPQAHADFSQLRQATWQMFTETGTCSGAMIAPKQYLTAAHCVGEAMEVNGKPATVLRIDEDRDLALLAVDMDCPCIPVSNVAPVVDAKIIVVGYPLGMAQYITEGRIQLYTPKGPFRFINAPVIFGNSGGPVVALIDGEYKVVGVTSALAIGIMFGLIPYAVPHLGIVASTESINEFLK